jgi:hypothetical protein
MFPLNIIVCPGEKINLHIFESRYRQLFHECDASGITFGIPFIQEGNMEKYCAEVALENIAKKYDDGTLDVTVKGVGLLKISKFYKQHANKLYPAAEIEKIPFDFKPDVEANRKIIPLLKELYELLNIINVPIKSPEEYRTSDNLHKMGLTGKQESLMLYIRSERERAQFILKHLEIFIKQARLMEQVKSIAAQNGHFKNLVPPTF